MLRVEASLEVGPGVDAGCGVALEVDVVAAPVAILAPEEVVEADLVEQCGRRIARKMTADAIGAAVGASDHEHGVPAHDAADARLELLVARVVGLLLGRDGVDVGRAHRRRDTDATLVGVGDELVHEIAGANGTIDVDDRIE